MYSTSTKWKQQIYSNKQCVMNVYFDNVLINPDYILDFKKGGDVFDEEFSLGSAPSQYIELQILKDQIPVMPEKIRVEYGILVNNVLTVEEVNAMLVGTLNGIPVKSISANNSSFEIIPMGTYNLEDYTDNDNGTLTLKALDNMINFEFNYDGSTLVNTNGSATLLQVAQDICTQAGVELGSTSFLNSDKQIAVYDNTVTAREYIKYIAESAGGFACIGRDGKLYFRNIYQDTAEIPIELFGSYKWSEEYKINKVVYEDGTRNFSFGDDTRNILHISQENMFIVDQEQIQRIYNQVKDLTINSFEGQTIIDPAIDIGDKIIVEGKPIIFQGEMSLAGSFIADIKCKIQIKQKEETTVKKESQTVINRKVQSQIDQVNGSITLLAQEQNETSTDLATLTVNVNGITIEVSAKVGEDEIISKINSSAEGILIQGDKLNILGKKVKFTTNIEGSYTFTQSDLDKIVAYIMGEGTLTSSEKELYDINKDGMVRATDYVKIKNAINNNNGTINVTGTFEIDPDSAKRSLILRDSSGNIITSVGLLGMQTQSLGAERIESIDATFQNLTVEGTFTNNSDKRLKTDIVELDDKYTNLIKDIDPVVFTYKKSNQRHIGFIAQDVEQAFNKEHIEPTLIKKDDLGIYSLDYIQLIGILWKDNKSKNELIEDLKLRIENLEKEVNK